MKAVDILLRGKVQQVFFRSGAQKHARKLLIYGFAKNMPDGTLSLRAEGEPESIDKFIAWCKEGPFFARVEGVTITETTPSYFSDFSIQ